MIEAAEKSGALKPGGTIVEATAGNTGLGLAQVAVAKGYKIILVVPDKMAREKILHLRALGADVRMTRSDVGKGHPEYYQDMAERIAAEHQAHFINQFANPANPLAHETGPAPEIWEQMDRQVDAGRVRRRLGRHADGPRPLLRASLAQDRDDPGRSARLHPCAAHQHRQDGRRRLLAVEGIGEDFVPPNADLMLVKHAYSIPDKESIETARELLEKEGILAGSSSGTLLAAALRYCRAQTEPSASSRWSATAATNISPRSTTTIG